MSNEMTVGGEANGVFENGGQQAAGATMETEDGEGMIVDLGGVNENAGYEPAPRGVYDCIVENLEYGKSQRSGNKMWSWTLAVESGEFAGKKKFFYHTTFNEGGMPRVKKTLARIKTEDGYEKQLLAGPFNPKTVADEGRLLGARCKVRVDIRVYEGQKRNDVKDILPPGVGGAVGGGAAAAGFAGV